MPALTPALVMRSPSSTNRASTSVITVGSSSESSFMAAQCVVAGRPDSKPGGCVDQAPAADTGEQRYGGALGAHPVEVRRVLQQPPGPLAPRVDQHVQGRGIGERHVGAQDQALGCGHRRAVRREARDRPPVLRVLEGPVRQHLPRPDRVELLDVVEEQETDVALGRRGCRAHGCLLASWGVRCLHLPRQAPTSHRHKCRVPARRSSVRLVLVGREPESAHLTELVEGARHGAAGSVVVLGEPGIGKSALLEHLVARAGDALVLRTQGLEVEAPLAFAALHRLLRPVMRLRDDLPTPQSRALRVAFGEEEGPGVEPFLVALATLSLLTTAAEEGTVLCVVDDAHWLDPASADALLFAARRLGADRVAMVFAARDGDRSFRPDGIPRLELAGLGPDAAQALLDDRLGEGSAEEVLVRLVAETHGNPLALLELPAELSEDQIRGISPLPPHLHLTTRVERTFLDRCAGLPDDVRLVLLLCAADDTGERAVVRRAADLLDADEPALEAAVRSGLLTADADSVQVRHPLVRSALYQAATGEQRRRVHRALADALVGIGDPDREAWHRAAATDGPDPAVVAALDRAGARAERRGGYVAACAAYERAAALTSDDAVGAALTYAAARNAWACGDAARSRALLSATGPVTDPLLRSDLARLRGRIEVNTGSAIDAHRIFVEAANAVNGPPGQMSAKNAADGMTRLLLVELLPKE